MAIDENVTAIREKLTLNENYKIIYSQLKSLLLDQFTWHNLPDEVDMAILENSLFQSGTVIFLFNDNVFYTLPALPQGIMDIYGYQYMFKPAVIGGTPQAIRLMSSNFKENDDCVIIRNLPKTYKYTVVDMVEYYAAQLAHIKTILNVNSALLAKPYVIVGNEKQIKDGLSELQDIFSYKPVIVRSLPNKKIDEKDNKVIDVIATATTANTTELQELYRTIMSEFLTTFGFNHIEYEKKERLITSEADSNNQLIQSGLSSLMLEERQKACDNISKLYNRDVTVELKHQPEEVNDNDTNTNTEFNDNESEESDVQ